MPSIGEIANEAKALLEDIKTNTLGTRNNTNTIINELNQLTFTNQAGFTNLADGLGVLIQLQLQNNELLASNNKQNEAIICWLNNIAVVLCDIKHNTDDEVKIQNEMSTTLLHLDKILELVHTREAMDVLKRHELEVKMDECCPKNEPKPQPCYSECKPPRIPNYEPIKPSWKPIHYEQVIPG
jgi:hypothetical protein